MCLCWWRASCYVFCSVAVIKVFTMAVNPLAAVANGSFSSSWNGPRFTLFPASPARAIRITSRLSFPILHSITLAAGGKTNSVLNRLPETAPCNRIRSRLKFFFRILNGDKEPAYQLRHILPRTFTMPNQFCVNVE